MSPHVLTHFIRSVLCAAFLIAALPGAAQTFSATGGPWVVPDGPSSPACGNFAGSDIAIPINVSGINKPISDIRVTITFPAHQNWAGDLNAILQAPNDGASIVLFGRIRAFTAAACGTAANWSGTYTFVDPSVSSNNIWTAAGALGNNDSIPPGTYMTTPRGGAGATDPPVGTSFIATFASLTPAQINGQWIVYLRDTGNTELITVNAVALVLPENCYDIDGNGQNNPFIDGLITLRAQLGLSGSAVTGGITFPGAATRTTWPAIRAFLVEKCAMRGVAN